MESPSNWECIEPGHLNADGASIEFEHTDKPYRAIVETVTEFYEDTVGYYTVIFDETTSSPKETIEDHKSFLDEDAAKNNLQNRMRKHN